MARDVLGPQGDANVDADVNIITAIPAGNNNIGDVDVASLPATPAGTNHIGSVAAKQVSDSVRVGSSDLTPKFAFANISASTTDGSLIAAVTSKKLRVLGVCICTGGTATTITFNSKGGGSGVAISASFANAANRGETLPFSPVGWFETVSGEALTVTTGSGSTTGVQVTYIEV